MHDQMKASVEDYVQMYPKLYAGIFLKKPKVDQNTKLEWKRNAEAHTFRVQTS